MSRSQVAPSPELLLLLAVLAASIAALIKLRKRQQPRLPYSTSSLGGYAWLCELRESRNPRVMRDTLGLSSLQFTQLLTALRELSGLADDRYMTGEEKLAIFLYMTRTGLTTRQVGIRFQHSTATIAK